MHINLVNAKDRYECGLRGVLASSFQDVVPEEKELLFCTAWLSTNACKSNAFICCWCREGEGRGLHILKNPLTRYFALKKSLFRFAGMQKGSQSHPLWIISYEPVLLVRYLPAKSIFTEFVLLWCYPCLSREWVSGNPKFVSSLYHSCPHNIEWVT